MTRLVVAGAVIEGGRLLLAQRARPAHLAGLWELPGGKVEAGESPAQALARELVEELGVEVVVGDRIGDAVEVAEGVELVALHCVAYTGTPTAREHLDIRWVDETALTRLVSQGAVVPADTAWVPEIVALLRRK